MRRTMRWAGVMGAMTMALAMASSASPATGESVVLGASDALEGNNVGVESVGNEGPGGGGEERAGEVARGEGEEEGGGEHGVKSFGDDVWQRGMEKVLSAYDGAVRELETTEASAEGFSQGLERARREALVAAGAVAADAISGDAGRARAINDVRSAIEEREGAERDQFRKLWVEKMQEKMNGLLSDWTLAAGSLSPEDEELVCQSEADLATSIEAGYDEVIKGIQGFNAPGEGAADKDVKIKLKVSGLDFQGWAASVTALKQRMTDDCCTKAAERAVFMAPEAFRSSLGPESLQGTADPAEMQVANFAKTLEWLNRVNGLVHEVCKEKIPSCLVDGPDDTLYAAKQRLVDMSAKATILLTEMASFVSATAERLADVSVEEADRIEELRNIYPRAIISRVAPPLSEIARAHETARSRIDAVASPFMEAVQAVNKGHQVASELSKMGHGSQVRRLATAAAANTIPLELDPAGLRKALDIAYDRVDTQAAIAERIVRLRHEQWRHEQFVWLAMLSTLLVPLAMCALYCWPRRRATMRGGSSSRTIPGALSGRFRRHAHEYEPADKTSSADKGKKEHV